MAPLHRVIIDTDPGQLQCRSPEYMDYNVVDWIVGVDDMLAMLLAFAAKPEEIEVLLLSVTYGNVEVQR
jgi:inosine-uridine nucleoside N-ribohydrolase